VLDAGERWLFSSTFTTKHADLGKVTNKAAGNGRLSVTTSATIYGTAEVTVKPIQIAFTSPGPETVITGPSITVAGTVNDPSITQVVIRRNGQIMGTYSVTGGQFSLPLTLINGTNTIEATITKPGVGDYRAQMIIDLFSSTG
jgi:hypothetical protein